MRNTHGFSLLELSIVIVCTGIMLSAGLTMFSYQQKMRRITETDALLADAKKALLGYAASYGHLPCAAKPDGDGIEDCVSTPTHSSRADVLPWATLKVKGTDAWGRRFTYRVGDKFTTPVSALPTPPLSGVLTVLATKNGTVIADKVAAVVISHGPNGEGSYNTQGVPAALGSDDDQGDNQLPHAKNDTNFVSKTPTATFDDQLTWISAYTFFQRMAGKF